MASEVRDPVAVGNRTPGRDSAPVEQGAARLDSVASALSRAEICVTSLADDDFIALVRQLNERVGAPGPRRNT